MKFKLTLSTIMQIELHLYHYTPVSNIIISTDSMPLLNRYLMQLHMHFKQNTCMVHQNISVYKFLEDWLL